MHRSSGSAPVAAGLLILAILAPSLVAQEAGPEHELTELADGVYTFRWQSHNSFFVVGEDGVLVVDPIGPEAARELAAAIRRAAPEKPLRAVAYSHDHADHASGAPALFAALNDAPILAHERAAEKIAALDDPDLPPPDVTISGTEPHPLDLGGRRVELRYLGESHSDNMLVAYLPTERIVFAVDFVSNDRVGYRDLPDYHYPEFLAAMRSLQELDYETIAFGHGPPGGPDAVERQIRYYEELRDAVAGAIEEGLSEDEAAGSVSLSAYTGWGGYEDWFPLNVRAMYRFLTEGEDR